MHYAISSPNFSLNHNLCVRITGFGGNLIVVLKVPISFYWLGCPSLLTLKRTYLALCSLTYFIMGGISTNLSDTFSLPQLIFVIVADRYPILVEGRSFNDAGVSKWARLKCSLTQRLLRSWKLKFLYSVNLYMSDFDRIQDVLTDNRRLANRMCIILSSSGNLPWSLQKVLWVLDQRQWVLFCCTLHSRTSDIEILGPARRLAFVSKHHLTISILTPQGRRLYSPTLGPRTL